MKRAFFEHEMIIYFHILILYIHYFQNAANPTSKYKKNPTQGCHWTPETPNYPELPLKWKSAPEIAPENSKKMKTPEKFEKSP